MRGGGWGREEELGSNDVGAVGVVFSPVVVAAAPPTPPAPPPTTAMDDDGGTDTFMDAKTVGVLRA